MVARTKALLLYYLPAFYSSCNTFQWRHMSIIVSQIINRSTRCSKARSDLQQENIIAQHYQPRKVNPPVTGELQLLTSHSIPPPYNPQSTPPLPSPSPHTKHIYRPTKGQLCGWLFHVNTPSCSILAILAPRPTMMSECPNDPPSSRHN